MLGLGNILTKGGAVLGFPNKYSFNLDGSNDYLSFDQDIAVSGDFSISWWMYVTSKNQGFAPLFYKAGNYVLYFKSGGQFLLRINTFGGVTLDSSSVVSENQWHHFALVRSGSDVDLYVDGTSIDDTETVSGGSFTFNQIGFDGSSSYLDALIDEVAVWDTALDANTIAKLGSKPVDVTKYSASNLKLWLRAGDKALPEEDASIARQDFYTDFDGTDDYVNVADNASLTQASGFSVTCWVKFDSISGDTCIVAKHADYGDVDNAGEFYIINDDGACEFVIVDDTNSASKGQIKTGVFAVDTWYHLACTYNGGTPNSSCKIYIDGVFQSQSDNATGSGFSSINNTSQPLTIGAFADAGEPHNGQISNLAMYKTELDAQTISQMAKSRFTPMRDNRFSVVDFDGTDDRIIAGNLFSGGGSTATFSTWVFADESGGGVDRIAGQTNSSSNMPDPFEVQWNHSDNTIRGYFSDGTASNFKFISSNATTANEWHHIVVTFDMSTATIKIYIDGVDETGSGVTIGSPPTSIASTSSPLKMGESAGGDRFKGSMSSVAIYDTVKDAYALYQKGITYNESSETSLIAYYRMGDDTSAVYPTIADSSSNSNDGTMTNMASDDIVQQMVASYDMGAFESSSQELGGEIIINGDLETWTSNTSPANWTVGDNALKQSGARTGGSGSFYADFTPSSTAHAQYKAPGFTLANGKLYKFQFYYKNNISGSDVSIYDGNAFLLGYTTLANTSNTWTLKTYYIIGGSGSTPQIRFRVGTTDETLSIDDVSVKEVLQSEVSDTYPFIADVTEPVLGAELVQDSDWTEGAGWADTGDNTWTWTSAENPTPNAHDGTSLTASNISGLTTGNIYLYKIQYTITSNSTNIALRWQNINFFDGGATINSTVGTHIYYGFATTDDVGFRHLSGDGTIGISNISLKQVFGNFGRMTNQALDDLVYSSVLPDQSFLTGVNSAYNFIDLDGVDEYIDCGDIDEMDGVTKITIMGWAKRLESNDRITFEKSTSSSNRIGLNLDTDGVLYANVGTGNPSDPSSGGAWAYVSLSGTDWNHIAMVYDGTQADNATRLNIYINGVKQSSSYGNTIPATTASSAGTFKIGRAINNSNYSSTGSVGSVNIFNKALSEIEVNAIYNLGRHGNLLDSYSDNLLGYWAMSSLDAKTGLSDVGDGTIYDRSGNSNHGTATNTESADLKSSPNAEPNGYAKGDTNRSTTTP